MRPFLFTLIIGVFIAVPVWAQQAGEQAEEATAILEAELDVADQIEEPIADVEEEQEEELEEELEEEFDEAGLDEQGFSNEDDDFRPTEEIPTDQSIDFPTDI